MKHVVVIGGGAAGFFAAMACAEKNPGYKVTILEKSSKLLAKVSVSGGGRCNVTHACFDPRQLTKFYPRGEKQLIGPFTKFNPTHTIEWFKQRSVKLKTESDGRMFPVTDSSQTIINCFTNEARQLGVIIKPLCGVHELKPIGNKWQLTLSTQQITEADAVVLTTGSSQSVWKMIQQLGHTVVSPVPSLFTFNIKSEILKGLEGISVPNATVEVTAGTGKRNANLKTKGPLLITHWGLSGPAILRLSAWGARDLAAVNHQFEIEVNWPGDKTTAEVTEHLKQFKEQHPKKVVSTQALFNLPSRLWDRLLDPAIRNLRYADLSNKHIAALAQSITAMRFKVLGKSTNKDEFVTAGGIELDEVDFKTMQSKKFSGLYFAGEVLDIDAITGGFNFQAAWTTGFIAGTCL